MPRSRSVALFAAVCFLVAAGLGLAAHGQPESDAAKIFRDLGARSQKEIASAARAYLDPNAEFLHRPRKAFWTALGSLESRGVYAQKDVPFLRNVVYQGRHYRQRFSDKKWQRAHHIDTFKKTSGMYLNLTSERWRFSYTTPRSYPKDAALDKKIPRVEPYPVLFCLHEEKDGRNREFPGEEVLKRRYPKGDAGALYEQWLVLAPVATRARFVDEDGLLKNELLIAVLKQFWQRYHTDFDRIILEGTESAMALAASLPHVFAGVVVRGGDVLVEAVPNFAHLPVYVVGDKKVEAALKAAGHSNVTLGDDKGVLQWMSAQRRVAPKKFQWNMLGQDHTFANWIDIVTADFSGPGIQRRMTVEVIDTPEDPNTIKIDAVGIERIGLWLSDEIVDLERDVRLLLNGEERIAGKLKRDLSQYFDKEPKVRENMYFGWLFPVKLLGLEVPAPKVEEPPPEPAPEVVEEVKGTPDDEKRAGRLWPKGLAAEAEGEIDKAKKIFKAIVSIGVTSYKVKAEEKLEALGQ